MSNTVAVRVVYIVDDDESVRQALSRLVDSAGLESRPCDSMETFLRRAPEAHDACALLDVSSPCLREPTLRSRVRATAAEVPVIGISARDDPETRRMAHELGAQAFFRKPVDAAALLDSIDWVMRVERQRNSG
jgi:FixJ family two-component response regulator